MKQLFLAMILILSGLAAVPGAQASEAAAPSVEAVEPCPQQPGYRVCSFETDRCQGDVRYYQHDSFFTYYVECEVGNLNCSYYSHSLYGYQVGHNCHIVSEASASDAPADAVAAPCQKVPGYRDCTVTVFGCTVGFRYYEHDGFFEPVARCTTTSAAADPLQCHGPLDGYQYCTVDAGDCQAGETYLSGDVHAYAECQPTDGKSVCGADAYSRDLLDLSADYHCMGREGQILPLGIHAAAAPPCAVSQQVYPGYMNIDVDCDPLVNCHLNNIEDSLRTCVSDTAACAEKALGVELGTVYTDGCHDPACETVRGLATDPRNCVVPEGVDAVLPSAAASADGSFCEEKPGYRQCDYTVGPCTVTTYYFYHDAFYMVDGPTCYKATASASGDCQQEPGYTRCDRDVGPCTVTTHQYHHDGRTDVEVCGLVYISPSGEASSSTAGAPCQQYPGYERCDYTVGPCTVTTFYYYHDAFYRVDRPVCEKPSATDATSSSSDPVQCWGLDGLLACEVEAGPCHAGFRYENPEVEDVHAQCF